MQERVCKCGEKRTRDISATGHSFGEWTETIELTCEEDGEKERTCLICSTVINTEVIPKLLVAPLEETDVIIDDDIIFTSTDLCNTIDSLVKFSENITYEVTPSLSTEAFLQRKGTFFAILLQVQ
jgi:hypothetical protein